MFYKSLFRKTFQQTFFRLSAELRSLKKIARDKRKQHLTTAETKLLEADSDSCALATIVSCIELIPLHKSATYVASCLGHVVELNLAIDHVQNIEPEKIKGLNAYFKKTLNFTHKRYAVDALLNKYILSDDYPRWTKREKIAVGYKLLETFQRLTNYITLISPSKSYSRNPKYFSFTPKFIALIRANQSKFLDDEVHHTRIDNNPPPKWSKPIESFSDDDRYLSRSIVNKHADTPYSKVDYKSIPIVYDALNTLQDTAWTINRDMLNIAVHLFDNTDGLGVIDNGRSFEAMLCALDDESDIRYKRFKYNNAHRYASKVVLNDLILLDAKHFTEDLFFPHYLDFRGRMYTHSTTLSSQGNDLSRSLLDFKLKKPLGSSGRLDLYAYGFKLFSGKQANKSTCMRWIQKHNKDILSCAKDPFNTHFWRDAKKPLHFLRFALEFLNVYNKSDDVLSCMPVHIDGSANVYQHLIAMCGDESNAPVVNLYDSDDGPYDLYDFIVTRVIHDLTARDNVYATHWLESSLLTRNFLKKSIIAYIFGSGIYGISELFLKYLNTLTNHIDGNANLTALSNPNGARYLALAVVDNIKKQLPLVNQLLKYIKDVTHYYVKYHGHIPWVSSNNFEVSKIYKKSDKHDIRINFLGTPIKCIYRSENNVGVIDTKKYVNSTPANLIHSIDAAHAQRIITEVIDNDIQSISCIHDSFATHAHDISDLRLIINKTFCDIHKGRPLSSFVNCLLTTYPRSKHTHPKMPLYNELDYEKIIKCNYAFN
ncbi:MAG: DNA-directed RNA polymerase [Candidatus Thiodiazotropha endolucinida]